MIAIITTDKPSYLYKMSDGTLHISDLFESGNTAWKNQNIYITSDEKLVLGGYHFNSKYGDEPQKTNQRDIDSRKYWEEEGYYITKIILTTDQDLIKDGVQAIDDEFLEWFVKNSSCKSVKTERLEDGKYVDYLSDGSTFEGIYENYKIIIPKEETKQETLEEAAERLYPYELGYGVFDRNCEIDIERERFVEGAKWQQERSYSEEDMIKAICMKKDGISVDSIIEKFKNK